MTTLTTQTTTDHKENTMNTPTITITPSTESPPDDARLHSVTLSHEMVLTFDIEGLTKQEADDLVAAVESGEHNIYLPGSVICVEPSIGQTGEYMISALNEERSTWVEGPPRSLCGMHEGPCVARVEEQTDV